MGDLALDSYRTWGVWFRRGITSPSWLNGTASLDKPLLPSSHTARDLFSPPWFFRQHARSCLSKRPMSLIMLNGGEVKVPTGGYSMKRYVITTGVVFGPTCCSTHLACRRGRSRRGEGPFVHCHHYCRGGSLSLGLALTQALAMISTLTLNCHMFFSGS